MVQCKDCKFYKPVDDTKGDCFGHEVPATTDASSCPTERTICTEFKGSFHC
ncbi:MAG: hypothetical protein P8Y97_08315 [Candidatus Lokiarchaeota archaeon]